MLHFVVRIFTILIYYELPTQATTRITCGINKRHPDGRLTGWTRARSTSFHTKVKSTIRTTDKPVRLAFRNTISTTNMPTEKLLYGPGLIVAFLRSTSSSLFIITTIVVASYMAEERPSSFVRFRITEIQILLVCVASE
ncbi:uncharacterized protein BO96DRAFT_350263 [Aspergillus niger CBS 101883]|uniref:Contig An01c0080, genomic contig n=2 Tax=Aspergillus niger TaxID=5061 RepID=A2Q802_ASPNC|nr:uncharacterized protein BO96DRAFT_350263 [Aspergillus niger CBS 101883]XP_059603124.1 uncharacterized protein An01g02560 [Aspergillus niger]PYH51388.1 hypothetical protein BO96DRAFT_350263 [Aspergillus niger CBS 101883]CAK43625.1 unnamed protein product [Aspergillus niger]